MDSPRRNEALDKEAAMHIAAAARGVAATGGDLFEMLDINKDGYISRSELLAALQHYDATAQRVTQGDCKSQPRVPLVSRQATPTAPTRRPMLQANGIPIVQYPWAMASANTSGGSQSSRTPLPRQQLQREPSKPGPCLTGVAAESSGPLVVARSPASQLRGLEARSLSSPNLLPCRAARSSHGVVPNVPPGGLPARLGTVPTVRRMSSMPSFPSHADYNPGTAPAACASSAGCGTSDTSPSPTTSFASTVPIGIVPPCQGVCSAEHGADPQHRGQTESPATTYRGRDTPPYPPAIATRSMAAGVQARKLPSAGRTLSQALPLPAAKAHPKRSSPGLAVQPSIGLNGACQHVAANSQAKSQQQLGSQCEVAGQVQGRIVSHDQQGNLLPPSLSAPPGAQPPSQHQQQQQQTLLLGPRTLPSTAVMQHTLPQQAHAEEPVSGRGSARDTTLSSRSCGHSAVSARSLPSPGSAVVPEATLQSCSTLSNSSRQLDGMPSASPDVPTQPVTPEDMRNLAAYMPQNLLSQLDAAATAATLLASNISSTRPTAHLLPPPEEAPAAPAPTVVPQPWMGTVSGAFAARVAAERGKVSIGKGRGLGGSDDDDGSGTDPSHPCTDAAMGKLAETLIVSPNSMSEPTPGGGTAVEDALDGYGSKHVAFGDRIDCESSPSEPESVQTLLSGAQEISVLTAFSPQVSPARTACGAFRFQGAAMEEHATAANLAADDVQMSLSVKNIQPREASSAADRPGPQLAEHDSAKESMSEATSMDEVDDGSSCPSHRSHLLSGADQAFEEQAGLLDSDLQVDDGAQMLAKAIRCSLVAPIDAATALRELIGGFETDNVPHTPSIKDVNVHTSSAQTSRTSEIMAPLPTAAAAAASGEDDRFAALCCNSDDLALQRDNEDRLQQVMAYLEKQLLVLETLMMQTAQPPVL